MNRIEETFQLLRQAGRAALMPYLTMGYPERESALSLVPALAAAGADLIELGVPFSDPLADGKTIQASSQRALQNGITLAECLAQVGALRRGGVTLPLVMMGYYNPILQFGVDAFAKQARAAGVDGAIVPDLPPEEGERLQRACDVAGLDLVYLLAPTSDTQRIRVVAQRSRGFVYLVSVIGVTGARDEIAPDLAAFVARVRAATDKPLAVGFGIGSPAQAAQVARLADGVIVGSALIRAIGEASEPVAAASSFVAALRGGIEGAA